MQIKKLILIIALLLSACAPSKKAKIISPDKRKSYTSLSERIVSYNLTSSDFDINKAEMEISNNGNSQKLIVSVKYRKTGDYLLTVRHRTGIEAARIFISKDTVIINDRIYKKLYCGSNEYLLKKYGIATDALPIVFGDFSEQIKEAEQIKDCSNGTAEIQGYLDNKEIWYYVACDKAKVTGITVTDKIGTAGINFRFGDHKKSGSYIYPAHINIEDISGKTKIDINIVSVDFKKSEPIEFIPGRSYEKIILK